MSNTEQRLVKVVHEMEDWQIEQDGAIHLSAEQRKPWKLEVLPGNIASLAIVAERPDGKNVCVNFEIEDGNLRLHLIAPGWEDVVAHITVADKGVFVGPGFQPCGSPNIVRFDGNGATPHFAHEGVRPEPWGAGWVELPEFGCAVRLDDGALVEVPLLSKGGIDYDTYPIEVSAPETQAYIDAVNEALGTSFKLDEFSGR